MIPGEARLQFVRMAVRRAPRMAARVLESLEFSQGAWMLRELDPDDAVPMATLMEPGTLARVMDFVEPRKAAPLLGGLPEPAAACVLRAMADSRSVLDAMDGTKRQRLLALMWTVPGSVGSIMDPGAFAPFADVTKGDALRVAKKLDHNLGRPIYVLGETGRVVGCLEPADWGRGERNTPLSASLRPAPTPLLPDLDIAEAAHRPQWDRYSALPVCDTTGLYLGVLGLRAVSCELARNRGSVDPDREGRTSRALGELFGLGARSLLVGALALGKTSEREI